MKKTPQNYFFRQISVPWIIFLFSLLCWKKSNKNVILIKSYFLRSKNSKWFKISLCSMHSFHSFSLLYTHYKKLRSTLDFITQKILSNVGRILILILKFFTVWYWKYVCILFQTPRIRIRIKQLYIEIISSIF